MVSKILAATDFSTQGDAATEYAALLAKRFDGEIVLFHVGTPPEPPPAGAVVSTEAISQVSSAVHGDLDEELRAVFAEQCEELRSRYQRGQQTLKSVHASGSAASRIQERLESGQDYDLVALGGHGDRGFRRLVLGSVAERIVRHAPCSAVVCPASDGDDEEE